ncbi:hypothetical protein JM80_2340 [Cellulophaga sp. RHA_52]|uniref:hypothetical protein n=1 Tax=Cellulophaga sp. RHA_52 TaxID=1250036 RepID=UPI001199C52D|nr:hypothetical protein [Cellulophaga sp. RHA_52]TVZ09808.1 hypothetical protein JM80_2340 [Cellulophaga sp. RHA_52]
MKIYQFKNSITYVLLAFFIVIKIAGLHSISHINEHTIDGDHHECTICDYINTHNTIPVVPTQEAYTKTCITTYNPVKKIQVSYNNQYFKTESNTLLFSRPPPLFSLT